MFSTYQSSKPLSFPSVGENRKRYGLQELNWMERTEEFSTGKL